MQHRKTSQRNVCTLLQETCHFTSEPVSRKKYKLACAPIDDSEQPAHLHSLIRDFSEL